MKEKIIKNRKYILLTLALLLLVTLNIGMRYLATRPRYKTLPEVRLVNQKEESTEGFAIMVPNESGDGYVEYEGDTWPTGYKYVEGKCVDNNGEIVENAVTYKDGKVELQTASTVYCTLYFDNKPLSTIEVLREKDTNGYLSTDLQGGMYRYQGTTSNSITNYICFGTKSQSECTSNQDKYMYRIIGITAEGQLYLIKNTPIKEGSTTTFAWNTAYLSSPGTGIQYCSGGVCPEWNEADLFKRINGTANGKTPGSGNGTHSNTDIFVDSTQYDYLKSGDENGTNDKIGNDWYNLIEDHEWMYGDTMIDYEDTLTYIGDIMYNIETGARETQHYFGTYENSLLTTYKWTNKVTAKISLMYIHDYIYSYYDGSNPITRGNPAIRDKTGWLKLDRASEWLSTRWGPDGNPDLAMVNARYASYGAIIYDSLEFAEAVRPVFYLSSNAGVTTGNGATGSPFMLG